MMYAIMPFLASAVLISSPIKPLTLQSSISASNHLIFTRVLPANNFVVYKSRKGDTLKIIANDYYGDRNYWTNIWNSNPNISNPNDLSAGLLVKLQILKPEKVEELKEDLKERLPKLVVSYSYIKPVRNYPQSNYEEVYKAAGEKYGVPWQILYGLHYTETGLRNGEIYNRQGSGAQGPMQFMPGTFRAYAVSADGGEPDINDAEDAIYTAANFLAKHGTLEAGLRSYGGNIPGTLAAARSRGYPN